MVHDDLGQTPLENADLNDAISELLRRYYDFHGRIAPVMVLHLHVGCGLRDVGQRHIGAGALGEDGHQSVRREEGVTPDLIGYYIKPRRGIGLDGSRGRRGRGKHCSRPAITGVKARLAGDQNLGKYALVNVQRNDAVGDQLLRDRDVRPRVALLLVFEQQFLGSLRNPAQADIRSSILGKRERRGVGKDQGVALDHVGSDIKAGTGIGPGRSGSAGGGHRVGGLGRSGGAAQREEAEPCPTTGPA